MSEDRSNDAGAREPECTFSYMRIPGTADVQTVERDGFAEVP